MSDEERLRWEKENNFVSLKTMQHKALDEIQNETNEQKFKEWLDKYSDLFEIIEDENGEKYIELRNKDFNCVLNSKKDVLLKEKELDFNNLNSSKAYEPKEFIKIAQTNNPKRRVKITMYIIEENIGLNNIQTYTGVKINGYRQIAAWVPYKTILYFKEVYGEIFNFGPFYFGNAQTNTEEYSLERTELINKGAYKKFYFLKAHGKGQSRGCGEQIIEIKYGY